MKSTYTEAFVEQALVKLFSRGDRTIRSVAEDLNVNCHTLKNWMKRRTKDHSSGLVNKEKRPQDWRAAPEATPQRILAVNRGHWSIEWPWPWP